MYSGPDTLERVGFPIRTSADQRSLASPRGFSQRATSFIASWRQGIHRTPLSRSHHASTARTQDQTAPSMPTIAQYQATQTHHMTNRASPASHANATSNPSSLVKEHIPPAPLAGLRPNDGSGSTGHSPIGPHPMSRALAQPSPTPIMASAEPTLAGRSGGKRIRTDDPLLAKQVLYQLSYAPTGLAAWTTSPAATKPPPQTRKP
jgi:hypothetical protein